MLPLLPEQASIEASFEEQLSEELGSLDFAEALPETTTPEQRDKLFPAMLRFLLQSGDRGYKDGVDKFNPEPSEANNWLYDADEEAFVGQFIDMRPGADRVFEFRIERNGDEWVRSFQPIAGVED